MRRLYDPSAPEHRRFSGAQQLADRFGPSEGRYDQVQRWCRAHGLRVVATSPNRLTLTVQGSRRAVAAAFAVRINDYRLGDATFFANDRDPSLPVDVAEAMTAVTGLSNLGRPRPVVAEFELSLIKAFCTIGATFGAVGTAFKTYDWDKAYLKEFARCLSATANNLGLGTLTAPDPPPPAWQGVDGTGRRSASSRSTPSCPATSPTTSRSWGFPPARSTTWRGARERRRRARRRPERGAARHGARPLRRAGGEGDGLRRTLHGRGSFQAMFNAMIDDGVDGHQQQLGVLRGPDRRSPTCRASTRSSQTAAAAGISVFNASGDTRQHLPRTAARTPSRVPASSPHATAVGGTSLDARARAAPTAARRWWDGSADDAADRPGRLRHEPLLRAPGLPGRLHARAPMRSIPDVVANADPAQRRADLPGGGGRLSERRALRRHERRGAAVGGVHGAPQRRRSGANLGVPQPAALPARRHRRVPRRRPSSAATSRTSGSARRT